MTNKYAIQVNDVTKDFKLPHEKVGSIKSGIVNIFKKKNKSVTTQHALRGISFDIEEGEFFGILGRNGSGKSTLLKILAEIYQPTSGKVDIKGKLVPFIELGVGFNPELTGRENVYLNGALLGFSRAEISERYDDIVKFAELEDFMDQKLKNYSSGMQVRLAFSVATRAEADILLVDEVLAVGDADFQRKCFEYFKSLKKSGKTVIFVTHDMGAVREYCDRAILINEGQVAFTGPADEIADEYLKLFNSVEDGGKKNNDKASKRWGNGLVKMSSKKMQIDDTIKFEMNLAAKDDIDGVVVGFRFYDEQGAVIAGASTVNARKGSTQGISFNKNERKKIIFESENILGTGTYRLGYTIRNSDMVTIYDDNEDLLSFTYNRPESYQPIICPVTVSINTI